jgi:hypothetical protein
MIMEITRTETVVTDFNKLPCSLLSFKKIFSDCINIEYLCRCTEKDKVLISDLLIEFATEYKIHTLFTKQGLEAVTDFVFTRNALFRDFILSLTDTYFVEIQGNIDDSDPVSQLISYLTKNVDKKFSNSKQSFILMPEELHKVLYTQTSSSSFSSPPSGDNYYHRLLSMNDWLVVMLLCILSLTELIIIVNQPDSKS